MPPVDPDTFADRIEACLREGVPDETLDALEQFSGPMLDELGARITTIETKSITILGWSTALLGFLLLQQHTAQSVVMRAVVILAVVSVLIAIFASLDAARARTWPWPNVRHWFCDTEFTDARRLRAVHLMALLRAYQAHATIAANKAGSFQAAQCAIVVAGLLVAVAVVLG